MSYTEKHIDQVDSYLSRSGGNGDSKSHLSKEEENDPSFKEALKDVEMLRQATRLERLQGKLDMLKEYESEIKAEADAQEEGTAKVVSLSRRRWVMGIAAGVLILVAVAVGLFTSGSETPNDFMAYLSEKPINIITERSLNDAQYIMRAMAYFEIDNYDSATEEFQKSDLPDSHNSQMYFGYSLMRIGKYSEGIAVLEKYLNSKSSDDLTTKYCRSYGEYFLAIGYLTNNQDRDKAVAILERLSQDTEVAAGATKLLEDIGIED
jgi:tetratricopeptide (TPR) repeat protein